MINQAPLSISAVVPVYNSEESLPLLIDRLDPVLAAVAHEYEMILVNDGSRDHSWEVITRLAAQNPRVHGLNLMRNFGQHNALLAGVRAASGEVIVTLDDDLQNPPEEISKLLAELDKGFDMVYGSPAVESHGLLRDLASVLTKWMLANFMGAAAARHVSAFRAFRTHLRDAFAQFNGAHISLDVLLTWGTTLFSAVCVDHKPRQLGRSNYTLRALIRHATNMLTGYSVLPLRLASFMGFAFTIFGMLVLIFVLGRFILSGGATVQGFTFLASLIAVFSGVQLFSLGIMGEYLGRMHGRLLDRPSYVVKEVCGASKLQKPRPNSDTP